MKKSTSIVRSLSIAAALFGSMALYATSVPAATIEGKLNGLECASRGEECPVDKLDPHIATERDFVVQTDDGQYYFVTNIDRAIKARHALEKVRVEGKLSPKFNAINANEFWVDKGNGYRLIWSIELQEQEERRMRGTGPDKGIDRS
ncbi:hypothetical protein [Sedimenticola hydrogenitrophicus]|uniref:hypothetical protein n=1 Tax=Sedimenticola hydrogenitrophicus TaxID=2967975 RepID=UPI0021A27BF0|nr:hypothetical protein [Sedimenticola hydrogenitrophicus]